MTSKLPLFTEVYGAPSELFSEAAERRRKENLWKPGRYAGLCPFTNRTCQKSTFRDPLRDFRRPMAVCSISDGTRPIIVCPERFKIERVFEEVAALTFPPNTQWLKLDERRLPKPPDGAPPGTVDHVLVAYDENGQVTDFCGIEVQAVYFSGPSMRDEYLRYMTEESGEEQRFLPRGFRRPDYRSSSKKRLLPQILTKGPFFDAWGKKFFVIIQEPFFKTLPYMERVPQDEADFFWMIYDLKRVGDWYDLVRSTVYLSLFEKVMQAFLVKPGDIPPVETLTQFLQENVNRVLSSRTNAPG